MTNPANDIVRQANNGSVAAIIQVLNDKLADSGVRTRAMFAGSVLQILCEAATPEQLEQTSLVQRVQQILEAIAPRGVRRVNINSRIVREQQLLWLDEISRDPENQLLWSQEITVQQPSFFSRIAKEWKEERAEKQTVAAQRSVRQIREDRQFWRGLAGGAIAASLLLLGGWIVYSRTNDTALTTSTPTATPVNVAKPATPSSPTAATPLLPAAEDPFANAVRLAEKATAGGKTATTAAEWLSLAADWQQASDLMAKIANTDSRYAVAQSRVAMYREKSAVAQAEATRRQQATVPPDDPSTDTSEAAEPQ